MTKTQSRPATRECIYSECSLPENNAYYLWQIVYCSIGVAVLISNPTHFTFFALSLFLVPIMLDLFYGKVRGKFWKITKMVFCVYNVLIGLFCFLGITDTLFLDHGSHFTISSDAVFFSNTTIGKGGLIILLVINLFVPFLLYYGMPTKCASREMQIINEIKE